MAVIGVEPAVKYPFVLKGMQTRRKGQYNAELTLSPRLYVKLLITPITAIVIVSLTKLSIVIGSPCARLSRNRRVVT